MSSKGLTLFFPSPNCYYETINLFYGNNANARTWHVGHVFYKSIKMFHLCFDERHNNLPRTLIINFGNIGLACDLAQYWDRA